MKRIKFLELELLNVGFVLKFSLKSNCKLHEKIHLDVKKFSCRYCKKKFILRGNCLKHEKNSYKKENHLNVAIVIVLSYRESCTIHEKTHENKGGIYQCQYCDCTFTASLKCVRHERLHQPYCLSRCDNKKSPINSLETVDDIYDLLIGDPWDVLGEVSK